MTGLGFGAQCAIGILNSNRWNSFLDFSRAFCKFHDGQTCFHSRTGFLGDRRFRIRHRFNPQDFGWFLRDVMFFIINILRTNAALGTLLVEVKGIASRVQCIGPQTYSDWVILRFFDTSLSLSEPYIETLRVSTAESSAQVLSNPHFFKQPSIRIAVLLSLHLLSTSLDRASSSFLDNPRSGGMLRRVLGWWRKRFLATSSLFIVAKICPPSLFLPLFLCQGWTTPFCFGSSFLFLVFFVSLSTPPLLFGTV